MALFNILVDIAASTARLESGLRQAEDRINQFAATADKAIKGVLGFGAAALSVDALAHSLRNAIDTGDKLQLMSQRMGATVTQLSALRYAAATVDVPFDELSASLDHFHQVLTRAELGGGRAGKALAALGIDAKKLIDLPFEQQLEAIADRLSKIDNPAKRAGVEMILFGETGAKLDPLLRQGAAGIQRLEQEAERAGVTIDGKMTEQLRQAHETIIKADAVWNKASLTLGAALAPAVEKVAGFFGTLATGITATSEALIRLTGGEAGGAKALQDELGELAVQRNGLLKFVRDAEHAGGGWLQKLGFTPSTPEIEAAKRKLKEIEVQMNVVNAQLGALAKQQEAAAAKQGKSIDISKGPELDELRIRGRKIYTDKMKALYDEFNKDTETSVEKTVAAFDRQEAQLNELRAQGIISQEEYAKRMAEILDSILPPIEVHTKKIKERFRAETDEMEQIGQHAAASIQGAFANFLFDPFHGGLKRLLADFLNTLRRMTAEAAASKIFDLLFGNVKSKSGGKGGGLGGILGDILGSIFGGGGAGTTTPGSTGTSSPAGSTVAGIVGSLITGGLPGLAEGGLVSAGSSYLVGEEGPELFTASSHGVITPNDQLGGTVNYQGGDVHIDARGADSEGLNQLRASLPVILAQHGARTKSEMLHAFRRSGLAAPVRA